MVTSVTPQLQRFGIVQAMPSLVLLVLFGFWLVNVSLLKPCHKLPDDAQAFLGAGWHGEGEGLAAHAEVAEAAFAANFGDFNAVAGEEVGDVLVAGVTAHWREGGLRDVAGDHRNGEPQSGAAVPSRGGIEQRLCATRLRFPGNEAGAGARTGDDVHELLGVASAGDDALDAAVDGFLHGAEFGPHAAGAEGALLFAGMAEHSVDIFHEGDGAFLGMSWITQEAGGAGEEDEGVGLPEEGHLGGELVVVSEAKFFDGNAVVFIDDGDDLGELEQSLQRALHAGSTFGMAEVLVGEEELRNVETVVPKEGLVKVHEVGLPNGGTGLERGHVARTLCEMERTEPRGNGPTADDDTLMPGFLEKGYGFDQLAQLHRIGVHASEFREDTGAELQYDALAWGHKRVGIMR